MPQTENLRRAALVTGGAKGIGRAICRALAENGMNIAVNYAGSAAAAEETAAACRALGVQAVTLQADVRSPEACQKLVEDTVAAFGRIDVLVNNAGITADKLLLRMTEADFDNVLATNLKGAFFCTKAACRFMMHQRYGRIISVSSVVGLHGNAGQANYAASKAGLIGLTKSVAKEYAARINYCYNSRNAKRFYCNRYDRRAVRTGPCRSTSGHPGGQNRPCRGCCGGGGFSGRGAGRVYYRAGPLR